MKLLIPISFFQGQPKSEIWSLDTKTGLRQRLYDEYTPDDHAVPGKGITGLAWMDSRRLVACDFNRVFVLDADSWQVIQTLADPEFNDLHHLMVSGNKTWVSNTGRDTIDVLDYDLNLLHRHCLISEKDLQCRIAGEYDVTPGYYDDPQEAPAFHLRKVPDRFHLNHITVCEDRLFATSFSERAMLSIPDGAVVSDRFGEQAHDGVIDGGFVWATTVDGKVYRAELEDFLQFELVVDLFATVEFQGWCRGLFVVGDALFVGVTGVYEKNERTVWLTQAAEETKTGVYEIGLGDGGLRRFFDFSSDAGSRIFSIVPG